MRRTKYVQALQDELYPHGHDNREGPIGEPIVLNRSAQVVGVSLPDGWRDLGEHWYARAIARVKVTGQQQDDDQAPPRDLSHTPEPDNDPNVNDHHDDEDDDEENDPEHLPLPLPDEPPKEPAPVAPPIVQPPPDAKINEDIDWADRLFQTMEANNPEGVEHLKAEMRRRGIPIPADFADEEDDHKAVPALEHAVQADVKDEDPIPAARPVADQKAADNKEAREAKVRAWLNQDRDPEFDPPEDEPVPVIQEAGADEKKLIPQVAKEKKLIAIADGVLIGESFDYYDEFAYGKVKIGVVQDTENCYHCYCLPLVEYLREHVTFRRRTKNLATGLLNIGKAWCEDQGIAVYTGRILATSVALAMAMTPDESSADEIMAPVIEPGLLDRIANFWESLGMERLLQAIAPKVLSC